MRVVPLAIQANAAGRDRIRTGRDVQTPFAYGNFVMNGRSFRGTHSGYSKSIRMPKKLYASDFINYFWEKIYTVLLAIYTYV